MCRRVMISYWCCFDILSGSQPGSCRSTVEGRGGTSLSPQSLSGPPTQQPGQIRHNNFPNVKKLAWTLFQLAIFWEVTNHYSQKIFITYWNIFSQERTRQQCLSFNVPAQPRTLPRTPWSMGTSATSLWRTTRARSMSASSSTPWTLSTPRASLPSPTEWTTSANSTAQSWPCPPTQSTLTRHLSNLQSK